MGEHTLQLISIKFRTAYPEIRSLPNRKYQERFKRSSESGHLRLEYFLKRDLHTPKALRHQPFQGNFVFKALKEVPLGHLPKKAVPEGRLLQTNRIND
jgi:hypothetical protein